MGEGEGKGGFEGGEKGSTVLVERSLYCYTVVHRTSGETSDWVGDVQTMYGEHSSLEPCSRLLLHGEMYYVYLRTM